MADKYHSIHTGQVIDSAITKVLNPSTTFNPEDEGKLADAKAVGELVTAEKERAEATYLPYDGYSQLARVGEADVADNLTPYSADSGTSQNTPFILQGTACANGEEQADTGSYCQLKEKRGNTVVVNQLAGGYNALNCTATTSDGVITITPTTTGGTNRYQIQDNNSHYPAPIVGHKYLQMVTIKSDGTHEVGITNYNISGSLKTSSSSWTLLTIISEATTSSGVLFQLRSGDDTEYYVKENSYILIDLTLRFGSNDKIPTHLLNHPEDFFRYYQGDLSHNVGTLTDCNGRYLKTTGRNACDEVFEGGTITQGVDTPNNFMFRTKNYQKIVPNGTYHLHSGIAIEGYYVIEFDAQKAFIASNSIYANNQTITLSPTTCFVRLCFFKNDSSWGVNPPAKEVAQIVFSLYYEDESGYDQYYPYEELANIDTGNEPLLAFDYKTPDGAIHRNTGRVDLGTLEWVYETSLNGFRSTSLVGTINPPSLNSDTPNIACGKYVPTVWTTTADKAIYVYPASLSGRGAILIYDSTAGTDAAAFKAAMSGVYFEYELAKPTTKQGTPFAENVAVDDFGTMSFDCPNGVPQGNLIFYPVDYKAEIDTLHNITEGDMHKLALKGDLAEGEPETIEGAVDYTTEVKNEAQDACGGTLRLLLSVSRSIDFSNTAYVDMGNLDWSVVEGNAYANCQSMSLSSAIKIDTSADYIYSTKYKAHSSAGAGANEDMQIYISSAGGVRVNDFALNGKTAAQIKDAMKGILLAYEKATT